MSMVNYIYQPKEIIVDMTDRYKIDISYTKHMIGKDMGIKYIKRLTIWFFHAITRVLLS